MTVMDFPYPATNGQTTSDGRYYFDSSVGSSGAWRSSPLPVGGLPAGSIIQWSMPTLPANWLLCDGSAVSRSVYSSLFAVVGTTYGSGDGSTTFNLPDIPNGDAAGVIGLTRINSQITVTTTPADLTGASVTVNLRAGRTYRMTFESPNLNGSASGRVRLNFYVNGAEVDRQYVGLIAGSGGNAINVSTYYTPTVDGSVVVKMNGFIDAGSPTSLTIYADAASTTILSVEDIGEAPGSSLRQRNIIKTSAGWTAGDSELATRVGSVEARATVLETAQATTNKSGLVPVVPTSVSVSSGSASVGANGLITVSGASSIQLNGVFSSAYQNYRILITQTSGGSSAMYYYRYTQGGSQISGGNYQYSHFYTQAASSGNTDYGTGATSGNLGYASHVDMVVYRPFDSTVGAKHITNLNVYGYTAIWGGSTYAGTGSFDGIIFSNTTYTGNIQVYGYR